MITPMFTDIWGIIMVFMGIAIFVLGFIFGCKFSYYPQCPNCKSEKVSYHCDSCQQNFKDETES